MVYPISVYCVSDIGLIRQNNEDASMLLKDLQFFVLADGMGGHQAGEVASKETVEHLCALFRERFVSSMSIIQTEQLLKVLIQEVNTLVFRMGCSRVELKGMGTTLCCILLHPEGLIYGHMGDSRIYCCRQKQLKQLTKDHSLLCELIELGQLSEQQAKEFLYKNIITKAIGTEPFVEPSVAHAALKPGDMILMCTDGLSDLVSLEEMQNIMNQNAEDEIVQMLVDKAKQKGGNDNITVILVKVRDMPK